MKKKNEEEEDDDDRRTQKGNERIRKGKNSVKSEPTRQTGDRSVRHFFLLFDRLFARCSPFERKKAMRNFG